MQDRGDRTSIPADGVDVRIGEAIDGLEVDAVLRVELVDLLVVDRQAETAATDGPDVRRSHAPDAEELGVVGVDLGGPGRPGAGAEAGKQANLGEDSLFGGGKSGEQVIRVFGRIPFLGGGESG